MGKSTIKSFKRAHEDPEKKYLHNKAFARAVKLGGGTFAYLDGKRLNTTRATLNIRHHGVIVECDQYVAQKQKVKISSLHVDHKRSVVCNDLSSYIKTVDIGSIYADLMKVEHNIAIVDCIRSILRSNQTRRFVQFTTSNRLSLSKKTVRKYSTETLGLRYQTTQNYPSSWDKFKYNSLFPTMEHELKGVDHRICAYTHMSGRMLVGYIFVGKWCANDMNSLCDTIKQASKQYGGGKVAYDVSSI